MEAVAAEIVARMEAGRLAACRVLLGQDWVAALVPASTLEMLLSSFPPPLRERAAPR